MTIKLENFTATIDVQDVVVTSVNDNLQSKTANVSIIINGTHGGTLSGFTYTITFIKFLNYASKYNTNFYINT